MQSFRSGHVLALAIAFLPGWAGAHEHQHDHGAPEKFGQVHFPTSCTPQIQPDFERALAMLHSFAYGKAAGAFEEVSAKDPACGIAQWGVAMTYFHVIWGPPTEDEFKAGRTASQKAAATGARTPRERNFIDAIGAYYQGDGVPHPARVVAFEKAMAGVAERNPDDHEAAIFHALSRKVRLAVNAWRAPEGIRERHGAHEIRELRGDRRSTRVLADDRMAICPPLLKPRTSARSILGRSSSAATSSAELSKVKGRSIAAVWPCPCSSRAMTRRCFELQAVDGGYMAMSM